MGDDVKRGAFDLDIFTIILFVLMFAISLAFFILLSTQTSADFGIIEILFSFAFALFMTFVLMWVRHMIIINPYLGIIIGVFLLVVFEYLLFFKYSGLFTTTFAIITALVVIVYLAFEFFKFRNQEVHNVDEFDED